jgi:uncharacterized membrane protein YfcA
MIAGAFLGAVTQSAVGFGFALIAAPAFLFAIQSTSAIQVLLAAHLVQSAMLVPRLVRAAPHQILKPMLAGGAIGLPVGLALFAIIDLPKLQLLLGITMLIAAGLMLAREAGWFATAMPTGTSAHPPGLSALVGACSGALTLLLVMPGPPLIIYLGNRPLTPVESRAVSMTFFAACYAAATILQVTVIGISAESWKTVAILVVPVALATWIGERQAQRLGPVGYRRALLAIMAISAVLAIWSAAQGLRAVR